MRSDCLDPMSDPYQYKDADASDLSKFQVTEHSCDYCQGYWRRY